jgi:hypothetical protein
LPAIKPKNLPPQADRQFEFPTSSRRTTSALNAKREALVKNASSNFLKRWRQRVQSRFPSYLQRNSFLAFPLARRYSLVKKLAGQMLARRPAEAERHLALELQRHRRVLRRRQLSNELIESQIHELQCAVRAELWRAVMTAVPHAP